MKRLYRIVLLFLCIFFATSSVSAQQYDPHDQMFDSLSVQDPTLIPRMQATFARLHQYADSTLAARIANPSTQSTPTLTIPVVVHVMHYNTESVGQANNISYAQIQSQINRLNESFAALIPNSGPYATDAGIRFCLAQTPMGPAQWSSSQEPGVMRYPLASNATLLQPNTASLPDMTALVGLTHPAPNYFPFQRVLNIWVSPRVLFGSWSVNAFVPHPAYLNFPLDGILIRSDCFGEDAVYSNGYFLDPNFAAGTICTHEVGHYLYMKHTFEIICLGNTNASCANSGDYICDTPPDTIADVFACNPDNSCIESILPWGDRPDMIENFMDYSDDDCFNTFTLEQTLIMRAYLTMYRPVLTDTLNLLLTGVFSPVGCGPGMLRADIFAGDNSPCVNAPVTFTTVPAPGNIATQWSWQCTNATPALVTNDTATVVFTSSGQQQVILTTRDAANNQATDTFYIFVRPCQPIAGTQGHWYFGNYMGLDFSSGTAQQDYAADINQTHISTEAAFCYSDSSGNLLYYTNGDSIWDRNHQPVATNLFGTNSQSRTQIIGTPVPGHPNWHYLFHGPASEDYPAPLYYSILSDSNGTIYPIAQNLTLPLPAGIPTVSEKITLVPHCNGRDFWLLTTGNNFPQANTTLNNSLMIWRISPLGITSPDGNSPLPALYSFGTGQFINAACVMKASPDGKTLAITGIFNIYLLDFDNSTGLCSNQRALNVAAIYGLSFSPDSKTLYYAESSDFYYAYSGRIMAVDLRNNPTVLSSFTVAQPQTYLPWINGVQLGPDSMVYIMRTNDIHFIGRISNPNNPYSAGYTEYAVVFDSLNHPNVGTANGFPNLMDAHPTPGPAYSASTSQVNCNTFSFALNGCLANLSIVWDFGDSQTDTVANPQHSYASAGTYTVVVSVFLGPMLDFTDTLTVIVSPPAVSISGATGACLYTPQTLAYSEPGGYAIYNWQVSGSASISGATNTSNVNVLASGSFTLTCTAGNDSICVQTDTLVFNPFALPSAFAGNDTLICTGASLVLGGNPAASGGTAPYTYSWAPASAVSNASAANPTSTPVASQVVAITVTDANGCVAADSVAVTLAPLPVVTFTALAGICNSPAAITLAPFASPVGGGFSGPGVSAGSFDPVAAGGTGSYTLSYVFIDSVGCTSSDTAVFTVIDCCAPVSNGINTIDQQQSSSYGSSFAASPVPVRINGTFYVNNNFSIVNYNATNAVQLAPNATIVVQNGASLTIDTSMLRACGAGMWQGIVVEPLATITVINSSVIRDAIEAVTIQGGAQYNIIKSNLLSNYRNLIVEPYAGSHPGVFYANHITGGILTLTPHLGIRTLYGIEVTDVDSIVFGAPGFISTINNANSIFDVQVGMHLVRSRVKNMNMILQNIRRSTAPSAVPVCCSLNNCTNPAICNPPPIGTAIHQEGGNLWMRNKNGYPFEAVVFDNVNIGVKAENSANMHLSGNEFKNLTNSNINSIPSAGVWVLRDTLGTIILDSNIVNNVVQGFVMQLTNHCTILIRENDFDKFVNGVRVIQQNKCGIKIGHNRFNMANNANFGTNAIRLQTAVATSSTDSTQVYGNFIYRCKTGVWLTSYKDAFVNESNSIWFGSATPATPEYGIRVQNSRNTTVDGNAVVRSGQNPNSDVVLRDNLYGISMQTGCLNSVVSNNGVMRLGTGIEFAWAGNFPATMSCNTMTWNMAGARFTNSFIGDQGSPIGNGVVHDNQWTFILSPNTHRTFYSTNSPVANWYSRTTLNTIMPTSNPIILSMQPTSAMIMVGAFPNSPQTCASNNDGNQSTTRQAKLADLALRNQPFDQMYEDELRMYDEQAFYEIMQDSSLLFMGTGYDAILQVYYDSLYSSATGQLSIAAYESSQGNNFGNAV
ncbi:MAG: M43 family zinc metalloprotease [Bacteroidia bacterium]|nr:M43 family zinc metalloprotease [Bacteroidia bacterium]